MNSGNPLSRDVAALGMGAVARYGKPLRGGKTALPVYPIALSCQGDSRILAEPKE